MYVHVAANLQAFWFYQVSGANKIVLCEFYDVNFISFDTCSSLRIPKSERLGGI